MQIRLLMLALGVAMLQVTAAGETLSAQPVGRAAVISVGPNILVSRDGNMPHVELLVAAHPRDSSILIGTGIVVGDLATHNTVYVSRDGGLSWTSRRLTPDGGVDPLVAFGPTGTAYFVDLSSRLFVYRSDNGGSTWIEPVDLGRGYDHPQIIADHGEGQFHGRVYIAVLGGRNWPVSVFRSEDDGRTWKSPVEFDNGRNEVGLNVHNPLVLSDGTLFVPYFRFEVKPEKQRPGSWRQEALFVTSTDGGVTFSRPATIGTEMYGPKLMAGPKATFTQYAVDRSSRYRDRIYRVWADEASGVPRITFQYSGDHGTTWSVPKIADASTPAPAWQYQPAIAVNKEGIVGVSWFDTRAAGDSSRYDQYFAASVDGGATFAPVVRVSSETSTPSSPGNRVLRASSFAVDDSLWVRFIAAAGRWVQGGDYMGLAADAAGDFHPFWADSRSETFQIYSARIRVEEGITAPRPPVAVTVRALSPKEFALVFNPTRYDAATSELTVPVQLRNKGAVDLRAPISARIVLARSHGERPSAEDVPVFLNSSNGVAGEGAVYDFTSAIGGDGVLATGSLTSPVTIRMRVRNPMQIPPLIIVVSAAVSK
jgi:hypothetical protein